MRLSVFQRWARLLKNMVLVEERDATKAIPMLKVICLLNEKYCKTHLGLALSSIFSSVL